MIKDVYQCCYTNAADNAGSFVASGWKPVAYSSNIPKDAMDGCVRFQKGNSNIKQAMLDENGNDLNLLEIAGDGTYLYIMRTQYGLKDLRGRRNMFSHAYCLPWNEELLNDPNSFLTIDGSNFATSEEDALVMHSGFSRVQPFDVQTALSVARIETADELASLIDAVYEQMTNRGVFEPLYVQYDGSYEQLAALLYCVYTYLPPYLRRFLVSASAEGNNASLTNVVFSCAASQHRFYFDTSRDTGNVLTPARRAAIKRLGFVDYAAINWEKVDSQKYFDKLEKRVASFSAPSTNAAQATLAYKVAHQSIIRPNIEEYTDDELDRSIDEALRLRTSGSKTLDSYTARLLEQMTLRKLTLMDGLAQDLDERVLATQSLELQTAADHYSMFVFERLSVDEAVQKLRSMDESTVHRYSASLRRSEKGERILDAYLTSILNECEDLSWEMLESYVEKTNSLSKTQSVEDALQKKAWDLYCASLGSIADIPQSLEAYLEIMRNYISEDEMKDCKDAALKEFWASVDERNIKYENIAVYEGMDDGSDKARRILDSLKIRASLENESDEEFLLEFHTHCMENRLLLDPRLRNKTLRNLTSIIEDERAGDNGHLAGWIRLVSIMPSTSSFQELMAIRETLLKKNYKKLPNDMEVFYAVIKRDNDWNNALRDTLNFILARCIENDRAGMDAVPLDVWLMLGSIHTRYRNRFGGPFTIFDDGYNQRVLTEDASAVVAESELIFERKILGYAEVYLGRLRTAGKGKSIEARAVDAWCQEVARQQKRSMASSRATKGETSKTVHKPAVAPLDATSDSAEQLPKRVRQAKKSRKSTHGKGGERRTNKRSKPEIHSGGQNAIVEESRGSSLDDVDLAGRGQQHNDSRRSADEIDTIPTIEFVEADVPRVEAGYKDDDDLPRAERESFVADAQLMSSETNGQESPCGPQEEKKGSLFGSVGRFFGRLRKGNESI